MADPGTVTVVCPICEARYRILEEVLRKRLRVRCSRCRTMLAASAEPIPCLSVDEDQIVAWLSERVGKKIAGSGSRLLRAGRSDSHRPP